MPQPSLTFRSWHRRIHSLMPGPERACVACARVAASPPTPAEIPLACPRGLHFGWAWARLRPGARAPKGCAWEVPDFGPRLDISPDDLYKEIRRGRDVEPWAKRRCPTQNKTFPLLSKNLHHISGWDILWAKILLCTNFLRIISYDPDL
ncbi:MAG: hypothetical protein S4CHLAM102_10540 [Chlamydiia bacterium]|nr:hypothetical protein [Chlamydiia bacterium]